MEFLVSKLVSAVAGLMGGFIIAAYWLPARLENRSKLAAGVIIGGTSSGCAVSLYGLIIYRLGLPTEDVDLIMGVSFLLGVLSIGVVNWVAVIFDKYENTDMLSKVYKLKEGEKDD